ncbi:hypothetical protein HDU97_002977 [Phlyctochytrium planicorne]|nr:hypothetical protein HDU97_002977 [Phlyctochytrium planicorne]
MEQGSRLDGNSRVVHGWHGYPSPRKGSLSPTNSVQRTDASCVSYRIRGRWDRSPCRTSDWESVQSSFGRRSSLRSRRRADERDDDELKDAITAGSLSADDEDDMDEGVVVYPTNNGFLAPGTVTPSSSFFSAFTSASAAATTFVSATSMRMPWKGGQSGRPDSWASSGAGTDSDLSSSGLHPEAAHSSTAFLMFSAAFPRFMGYGSQRRRKNREVPQSSDDDAYMHPPTDVAKPVKDSSPGSSLNSRDQFTSYHLAPSSRSLGYGHRLGSRTTTTTDRAHSELYTLAYSQPSLNEFRPEGSPSILKRSLSPSPEPTALPRMKKAISPPPNFLLPRFRSLSRPTLPITTDTSCDESSPSLRRGRVESKPARVDSKRGRVRRAHTFTASTSEPASPMTAGPSRMRSLSIIDRIRARSSSRAGPKAGVDLEPPAGNHPMDAYAFKDRDAVGQAEDIVTVNVLCMGDFSFVDPFDTLILLDASYTRTGRRRSRRRNESRSVAPNDNVVPTNVSDATLITHTLDNHRNHPIPLSTPTKPNGTSPSAGTSITTQSIRLHIVDTPAPITAPGCPNPSLIHGKLTALPIPLYGRKKRRSPLCCKTLFLSDGPMGWSRDEEDEQEEEENEYEAFYARRHSAEEEVKPAVKILEAIESGSRADCLIEAEKKRCDVVMLCFNIGSQKSIDNLRSYWKGALKESNPGASIVLVGCKSDLRDSTTSRRSKVPGNVPITFHDGLRLAKEIGAKSYAECSSMQMKDISPVFEQVARVGMQPVFANGNAASSILSFFGIPRSSNFFVDPLIYPPTPTTLERRRQKAEQKAALTDVEGYESERAPRSRRRMSLRRASAAAVKALEGDKLAKAPGETEKPETHEKVERSTGGGMAEMMRKLSARRASSRQRADENIDWAPTFRTTTVCSNEQNDAATMDDSDAEENVPMKLEALKPSGLKRSHQSFSALATLGVETSEPAPVAPPRLSSLTQEPPLSYAEAMALADAIEPVPPPRHHSIGLYTVPLHPVDDDDDTSMIVEPDDDREADEATPTKQALLDGVLFDEKKGIADISQESKPDSAADCPGFFPFLSPTGSGSSSLSSICSTPDHGRKIEVARESREPRGRWYEEGQFGSMEREKAGGWNALVRRWSSSKSRGSNNSAGRPTSTVSSASLTNASLTSSSAGYSTSSGTSPSQIHHMHSHASSAPVVLRSRSGGVYTVLDRSLGRSRHRALESEKTEPVESQAVKPKQEVVLEPPPMQKEVKVVEAKLGVTNETLLTPVSSTEPAPIPAAEMAPEVVPVLHEIAAVPMHAEVASSRKTKKPKMKRASTGDLSKARAASALFGMSLFPSRMASPIVDPFDKGLGAPVPPFEFALQPRQELHNILACPIQKMRNIGFSRR